MRKTSRRIYKPGGHNLEVKRMEKRGYRER